ncbi:MAG TPA: DUF3150 domain-containing protein [Abditibacterium sp.]
MDFAACGKSGDIDMTSPVNASAILASKSLLSSVRISQWSARKVDKAVTAEINTAKNAETDAGRYNKMLIDPKALAPINKAVSEARTLHLEKTLPWQDDGARLLPSAAFVDYKIQLETIKRKFDTAVSDFVAAYDVERKAAEKRLGDLFKAADYPTQDQVAAKFAFELVFNPVPTAGDFRVTMADAQAEVIRAEIEARAAANLQEAMRDVYRRVGDVCERMADTLTRYKPSRGNDKAEGIFRNSLVTNVTDLAAVLPTLNIVSDPKLAEIAERMRANLTRHDADALRENSRLRKDVASEAQAILDDIADFIM